MNWATVIKRRTDLNWPNNDNYLCLSSARAISTLSKQI